MSNPSRASRTLSVGPSQNQRGNVDIPIPDADSDTERPTQPSQRSFNSGNALADAITKNVATDLVGRLSRCQTVGALVRLVPAPAQDKTKVILDNVYDSYVKRAAAKHLLLHYEDVLEKEEYDSITELNSFKKPKVQYSKLSEEANPGSFTAFNFSIAITTAKKAGLDEMIRIKKQEIRNLDTLCEEENIQAKVTATWMTVSEEPSITPEHEVLLLEPDIISRVVRTAISIGLNAVSRSNIIKEKKNEKKATAEKRSSDPLENQEQIKTLVSEMINRQKQSDRDRQKLSGKGKGRAGPPSKKKNQRKEPAPQRVQKRTQGPKTQRKPGSSTKKQRKRR